MMMSMMTTMMLIISLDSLVDGFEFWADEVEEEVLVALPRDRICRWCDGSWSTREVV